MRAKVANRTRDRPKSRKSLTGGLIDKFRKSRANRLVGGSSRADVVGVARRIGFFGPSAQKIAGAGCAIRLSATASRFA
jgi:hypothetical protein